MTDPKRILAIDPGNTVEKACTGCGVAKPLSDYGRNAKGRYGRQAMCKPCISARYYEPRKEQLLAASRARRATQEGRDRENRQQRDRRRAQPDKVPWPRAHTMPTFVRHLRCPPVRLW